MIDKDFEVDFKNRKIKYTPNGSGKSYSTNEFYSFLQEIFARPQNMNYEIPIEAGSKTKYSLTNEWIIDEEAMKHIEGGNLMLEVRSLDGRKFKVLRGLR